jgi:hypothetical protein
VVLDRDRRARAAALSILGVVVAVGLALLAR